MNDKTKKVINVACGTGCAVCGAGYLLTGGTGDGLGNIVVGVVAAVSAGMALFNLIKG